MKMEIRTLGPFSFNISGTDSAPSTPKSRAILALLSVRGNEVVPVADIIRELWWENPPRTAVATIQSHIVRLRRMIDEQLVSSGDKNSSKELIETFRNGYRLNIDRSYLDFLRFEEKAISGAREMSRGDWARASILLRDALSLWRGTPLVDVDTGPVLEAHATRLETSRLATYERCMEAELRLGRHHEVVWELTSLAATHPYHEGLHAQLITALYLSGFRYEALEAFGRLRASLAADLGLDPSPRISKIHQKILNGSPELFDALHDDIVRLRPSA
jgi:SARP family transcriptional regulator, regulator of embCAB operon